MSGRTAFITAGCWTTGKYEVASYIALKVDGKGVECGSVADAFFCFYCRGGGAVVKNVILAVLVAACAFLAANQYMERKAWEEAEISPAEYGGLAALRDMFLAAEYRDRILPLLRQAFVDGKVTNARLREFGDRLEGLGKRTLDILEAERAGDRVSRAWDDARDGAASLGESIGREMGKAMRELGDAVEGLKPKRRSDSNSRSGDRVEL